MKNKHLTYEERHEIENMLAKCNSISQIAAHLKRNLSTISKEIRKHRFSRDVNTTQNTNSSLKKFNCTLLEKPPYVCNGCKKKRYCHNSHYLYHASRAQKEYESNLRESREGTPLNKNSFYELDRIVSTSMKQGQHLYHIHQNNNLGVSLSTLYRYLNKGYLSASVLDAPRIVRFKKRKSKPRKSVPKKFREGRTYKDFQSFIKNDGFENWVELDTVIGRQGGKSIMTINFTLCNFMVGFLLDFNRSSEVSKIFDSLRKKFSDNNLDFDSIIPVVLTDNGSEFSDVNFIENNGKLSLFFCDPMRSDQKGRIEKNHTLFRDICPKGISFDNFSQENINLIFSHVNSISRASLNGKTPYEIFEFTYGKKITSLLGIKPIPAREVIQSPMLIKKHVQNNHC